MKDLMVVDDVAVTMTSLEMVEFINSQRGDGEAELRHRDFTAKVPKVLGKEMSEKFRASLKDSYGRGQPGYRFPKREACLMAMSYSYDLQAKVFDRMTALEDRQRTSVALPNFSNPAEAARAWAEQYEARVLAEKTKAETGSRREATAMNTASQAIKKAARLEEELDRSRRYASVKRMEMVCHGVKFNWRLLKSTSIEMGIPSIDVFDQNYGTVKAYHADVWREAYAVEIE